MIKIGTNGIKDLEDEVCETDEQMAKQGSTPLKPELYLFQRVYNPLHFYCRLKDTGFNPFMARIYSKFYEVAIYNPLIVDLKEYFGVKKD